MNIEIITAPIIGGVIGLLTNSIAIKMIFRPYHEIKIGKFKVPFTPGLIPKERPRIAKAIGEVVGNQLLDSSTLTDALCAENVHEVFEQKCTEVMDDLKKNQTEIYTYLEKIHMNQLVDNYETQLSTTAADFVTSELIRLQVSAQLVDAAMQEVSKKLNPLLMTMAGGAITAAKEPMIEKLDEMIQEHCPEIVTEFIEMKYQEIKLVKVGKIATELESKSPYLNEILWNIYVSAINQKAKGFLKTINIAKIVEDKINELDIQELETMILSIAKKELNAVVWLGGLLGVVMGFINLLF